MAKSILVEFDNGYGAKVQRDGDNVVLRLRDNSEQPTGYVDLSPDDNTALRDVLMHFL